MRTRALRSVALGGVAAGLVTIALAPGAFAASTNSQSFYTNNIAWDSAYNDALDINDAEGYFSDFMGTGVETYGWNSDAFDDFLDANYTTFSYPGYGTISADPTPATESYVEFGTTVITATQSLDFGDGITYDITFSMTIQGNYVKWAVTPTATGAGLVGDLTTELGGDLGSDEDTVWTDVDANSKVSIQDGGGDPAIAYHLTSSNNDAFFTVADGNDSPYFTGTGTVTLIVMLSDYDPCSVDTVVTTLAGMAPNLATTFGQSFAGVFDPTCIVLGEVVDNSTSSALDLTVPVNSSTALENGYSGYFQENGNSFALAGAPAGVTVDIVYDGAQAYAHITGPALASLTNVKLVAFESGEGTYYPVYTTINLPATTTGAGLAETGTNASTPWVAAGAALLVVSGAALLVLRRREDA